MSLYQIVGLSKTTETGQSYQTDDHNYILHDDTGKGITRQRLFTKYILYVSLEKSYYAIHLSSYDCASFYGKLCYIGMMRIVESNSAHVESNITYFPIKPIFVNANFEIKSYDYDDHMDVYLHDDPDTFIFKFSSIGDNEANPLGYAYVNMKLFQN
uniref:Uncharacterized protein n=1 Tax=viral metagenome TaxID=1070528 RepID=A0A6C0E1G5_9ZZZZ